MEIVCKNCNTSHYLSDERIPLETKTGKCKQCSAPITVLGKNALGSIELSLTQSTPPEPEATKNCDFCGEKILAIAKKCRHCGSMLDGNHAANSQSAVEPNIKPDEEIAPPRTDGGFFNYKHIMKKTGILLIASGILIAFLAFNMEVVVGTTYNIGLLNNRQNIIYLSGVLFASGIMLLGFGVIAKEESKNIKTFVFYTVLIFSIPIVFFPNIQEYIRQEETRLSQEKHLRENMSKFIDNTDGTVTFVEAGKYGRVITWQRCSVGQTWTGTTCNGEAKKMTWDEAMKFTSDFAGHNDWRLPTEDELLTLVYCSDTEYTTEEGIPDIYIVCKNSEIIRPTINGTYFPNTPNEFFWSSSEVEYGRSKGVSFSRGDFAVGFKTDASYVRLVQGY
jgi:predicted Zn finger-like uncharacterized protein